MIDIDEIYIDEISHDIYRSAKSEWDSIAKPIDGLGQYEDIICRIAAIRRDLHPDISRKALVIMCADNGVVAEGVSQCGQEVTADVARLMVEGHSSVGVLRGSYALDILPIDIGMACDERIDGVEYRRVRTGTGNIRHEAAMSREECLEAIAVGIDVAGRCARQGYGLIATGEMGIGNTTTSTTLICALTGLSPDAICGRGAGLDDAGLDNKRIVIRDALALHGLWPVPGDISGESALEALRLVGGLDIAGLVGVYIGAAFHHIPVVIDGLISAAAALVADMVAPGVREYMIASHSGREKGVEIVLARLGLSPVIAGNMALGEGTGAVMLMPLLDMAMNLYREGVRFVSTDIDSYTRYA